MADISLNFKVAGQEIVTGALREIGSAAVNFLGEAAGAFVDFASDSFKGALDAQAGIDKLNATITRLGETSPITSAEALALADQFKNLAGGSDDAILSAENVLLRFNAIGKDTFPQVLTAAADLSTVMGTDLNSAATLIGKTLQDLSTDGTASLGKLKAAGVELTDAQEKQIQKMVKAGDVAGAQKVILDALAATTGGAAAANAETLTGKWAIFQETIADAGEGIGMKLLPILSQLFDQIIAPNIPIVEKIADSIGSFVEELVNAFTVFGDDTVGGISNVLYYLGQFVPVLNDVGDAVINAPELFSQLASALQPVINAAMNVMAAFQESMPMIQATVNDMVAFVQGLIAQFGPTITANIQSALSSMAAFWTAHGAQIMAVVDVAFKIIAATIGTTLTLVSGLVSAFSAALNGDWSGLWTTVETTITSAMNGILSIVGIDLDSFLATWGGVFDQVVTIVTVSIANAGNALLGGLQSAINGAWTIISGVSAIGTAIVDGIKNGISNALGGLISAAVNAVTSAVNAAKSALGIHSPSAVFAGIGANMMAGMAQGIERNAGAPAAATTAAAQSTIINVGGMSINGAGNPQAVAAAVRAELDRVARSAENRRRF